MFARLVTSTWRWVNNEGDILVSVVSHSLKILLLAASLVLALPLHAGELPKPDVPEARAKATEAYGCVRPVEEMRKNHMKYLLGHRDETLREGVRTKQFSLKECVNCHVSKTAQGTYPKFGSEKHFCSSCHHYAAVEIDCFQCHRDKPADTANRYHPHPLQENQAGLTLNQSTDTTDGSSAGANR